MSNNLHFLGFVSYSGPLIYQKKIRDQVLLPKCDSVCLQLSTRKVFWWFFYFERLKYSYDQNVTYTILWYDLHA